MIAEQDEFEKHARAALQDSPGLANRLLTLRKQVQDEGEKAWSKSKTPTASMLNDTNRRMIDKAASLLGPAKFELVFGFSPNEKFNLVDPRIMRPETKATKKAGTKIHEISCCPGGTGRDPQGSGGRGGSRAASVQGAL